MTAQRVRILIDDPGGRFRAGEIGEVIPHTYEKYDYFVKLPGDRFLPSFDAGEPPCRTPRRFYFHAGEVELIDDGPEHSEEEDEIERARRLV